jgi:hypothetical protein
VIVKTNLEMPSQMLPLAAVAAVQTSAQLPKAFSDSLLVASKAFSETGGMSNGSLKAARRQSSTSEHANAPTTVPDGDRVASLIRSHQTAPPKQAELAQPSSLNNSIITSAQIPVAGSDKSAASSRDDSTQVNNQPDQGGAVISLSGIESRIAQSGAVPSICIQPSQTRSSLDSLRSSSILPGSKVQSLKASVAHSSETLNSVSNPLVTATSNDFQNAALNGVQNSLPTAALNAIFSGTPTSASNSISNATANSDTTAIPNKVLSPIHNSVATTFHNPIPTVVLDTASSSPQITPLNAAPTPVPHDMLNQSAKGDGAAASDQFPEDLVASEQTGLEAIATVPSTSADQIATLIQPNDGLAAAGQNGVSGLNSTAKAKPSLASAIHGTVGAKDTASKTTGLKQQALPTSEGSATQASSQEVTPSRNQSQGASSSQGQNTATTQMNLANHAVATTVHTLNTVIASPGQTSSTVTDTAGHATVKPESATPSSVPLPQAPPIINTAKLIQSMGQSEMRVGMRSNEFGNISISTSSSRDLISAQISLDHSELAKTLASHLPEFQQRLGIHQAMDVRIDLNGQRTDTSSGMSNGSAEESHGGMQQARSPASSPSGIGIAEGPSSEVATSMRTGEGRLDARLDIRV